jgi:hypothetical protein
MSITSFPHFEGRTPSPKGARSSSLPKNASVIDDILARSPYSSRNRTKTTRDSKRAIPKRINFFWMGKEIPQEFLSNILKLSKYNPTHNLNIWGDKSNDKASIQDGLTQLIQYETKKSKNKSRSENFRINSKAISSLKKRLGILETTDAEGLYSIRPSLQKSRVRSVDDVFPSSGHSRAIELQAAATREQVGHFKNLAAAADILRGGALHKIGGWHWDPDIRPSKEQLPELVAPEGILLHADSGPSSFNNNILAVPRNSKIVDIALSDIAESYKVSNPFSRLLEAYDRVKLPYNNPNYPNQELKNILQSKIAPLSTGEKPITIEEKAEGLWTDKRAPDSYYVPYLPNTHPPIRRRGTVHIAGPNLWQRACFTNKGETCSVPTLPFSIPSPNDSTWQQPKVSKLLKSPSMPNLKSQK